MEVQNAFEDQHQLEPFGLASQLVVPRRRTKPQTEDLTQRPAKGAYVEARPSRISTEWVQDIPGFEGGITYKVYHKENEMKCPWFANWEVPAEDMAMKRMKQARILEIQLWELRRNAQDRPEQRYRQEVPKRMLRKWSRVIRREGKEASQKREFFFRKGLGHSSYRAGRGSCARGATRRMRGIC